MHHNRIKILFAIAVWLIFIIFASSNIMAGLDKLTHYGLLPLLSNSVFMIDDNEIVNNSSQDDWYKLYKGDIDDNMELKINLESKYKITGNLKICEGGETRLCAPEDMNDYTWSLLDGTTLTARCIDVDKSGKYCVNVVDSKNNMSQICADVIMHQRPECEITGEVDICIGESTRFCAPKGMKECRWICPNGSTSNVRCIDAKAPGEYCIKIVDKNGCESTCCKYLNPFPEPDCEITGSKNICGGEAIHLCAPEGMVEYVWKSSQAVNRKARCIDVNSKGQHCVTIVDNNSCESTCCTEIALNPLPECKILSRVNICKGESTTLSAPEGMKYYSWNNPYANVSTYSSIMDYEWEVFGDGWEIISGQGTESITYKTGSSETEGIFSLWVTDENGCAANSNFAAMWTSAHAIKNFLPDRGKPSILREDSIDPDKTSAGILASKILTLCLNTEFSCTGVLTLAGDLSEVPCYKNYIITESCGGERFTGMTIGEFLEIADEVLGGNSSFADPKDIESTASCLNNSFEK